MGIIVTFQSPETGHDIASGIVRDDKDAQPSNGKLEVRCHECGHTHVWDVALGCVIGADRDERLPVPVRIA